MPSCLGLRDRWNRRFIGDPSPPLTEVYEELVDHREAWIREAKERVLHNLVQPALLIAFQHDESLVEAIAARLPDEYKVQLGDLCEVLGTEHAAEDLGYEVPIRRLRYKDTRNMSMRGEDLVGLLREEGQPPVVLKAEMKARSSWSRAPVEAIRDALDNHEGRPNPDSIGFLIGMLFDQDRKEDALLWARVLSHPDEFEFRQLGVFASSDVREIDFWSVARDSMQAASSSYLGLEVEGLADLAPTFFELEDSNGS